MAGIDAQYLKDLEQVLQAEAALLREGTDLLADPEYRALRELFVDGELSMAQFAERVENLAETRPEQDVRLGADAGLDASLDDTLDEADDVDENEDDQDDDGDPDDADTGGEGAGDRPD